MSMTLDDLRAEWADRARRLDAQLRGTATILRDDWIEKHRERIGRAEGFGKAGMAIWIATMALLGLFLATHAREPALFATAMVLDLWVVAAGVGALARRQALRDLDYGRPVAELQARVEALRIARIRAFNVELATGQIVWWIPFFVVLVDGLFGVNLYAIPGFPAFAAANVAAGVAAIPIAIALARRYGERLSRTSWARRVADSIAGRDIAEARGFLAKLARLESEVQG
ncbi:MAG TPA: hypothetical protein VLY46_11575 [Usitatibacter sp.]|nr:hypothetical protein [Usitatibacter sp.]